MTEKEDIGKTELSEGIYFLRIIANEQIIPNEKFTFHEEDYEKFGERWITLDEIAAQLKQMGYHGVYYVWQDTPLNGTIYQYGNHLPERWENYGRTNGYA